MVIAAETLWGSNSSSTPRRRVVWHSVVPVCPAGAACQWSLFPLTASTCFNNRSGSLADSELTVELAQVKVDGRRRHRQVSGDDLVGVSEAELSQSLPFTRTKRGSRRLGPAWAAPREHLDVCGEERQALLARLADTECVVADLVVIGYAGAHGGPGGAIPRDLLATWLRLAIFETMSRGEGDQRLWFVIDELDSLGQIDGLKDALARLRKFGGRCVLGFQSIAQVRGTYGETEAQTIVENCGNTLILRCSASEHGGTAEFASRLIGKRGVIRQQASHSRPTRLGGRVHQTRTMTEQHATEDAVMASEIEQLPVLTGFLKLASRPEWRRVTVSRG